MERIIIKYKTNIKNVTGQVILRHYFMVDVFFFGHHRTYALNVPKCDMFNFAFAFLSLQLSARRLLPLLQRAVLRVSTTFQTTTISVFLERMVTFPLSWWHKNQEPSTTSP